MGIIKFLFGKKPSSQTTSGENSVAQQGIEEKDKGVEEKTSSLITSSSEEVEKKRFWSHLFIRNELNHNFFEELEDTLIRADLGARISGETVEDFRELLKEKNIKKPEEAITLLKEILLKLLLPSEVNFAERKVPVICLVGINGVGKTTTLAKLSHHYREQGYAVVIGAADTFRAAAIPQLEEWAKRTDAQLVNKGHLSDAAAVAYDAVEATLAKGGEKKSICLIDTAGRLENKANLMEQLGKMIRILSRFSEQTDVKKILVADATLGRNGMDQAKVFTEKIGLDGIILTKADTQAKAGFLLTISRELKLPIWYITHGENIEALSPFNGKEYVEALLSHLG